MRNALAIEPIEAMRREAGIDDVELRRELRRLRVGDLVRLTLVVGTKPFPGVPLLVRITRIRGTAFRGRLAGRPPAAGPPELRVGSPVAFTAGHIHSIPPRSPSRPG